METPTNMPIDISSDSGNSATWAETMKSAVNVASASSLAPKTRCRGTGSAISTRKSVSSGNSEWPTSTVTKDTIHIGTAMRNAWFASSASRKASGLGRSVCAAVKMRVSRSPNENKTTQQPRIIRVNESAARVREEAEIEQAGEEMPGEVTPAAVQQRRHASLMASRICRATGV